MLRTQDLGPENCDAFFISFCSPHEATSSQTLSRWVKPVFNKTDIVVNFFPARFTRDASTPFTASKGINLDEFRRTARWTRVSEVFVRFYSSPIMKTLYVRILSRTCANLNYVCVILFLCASVYIREYNMVVLRFCYIDKKIFSLLYIFNFVNYSYAFYYDYKKPDPCTSSTKDWLGVRSTPFFHKSVL